MYKTSRKLPIILEEYIEYAQISIKKTERCDPLDLETLEI